MAYQSYEASSIGQLITKGAGKMNYWLVTVLSASMEEKNLIIMTAQNCDRDQIRQKWYEHFNWRKISPIRLDISRLGIVEKDQLDGVPTVRL